MKWKIGKEIIAIKDHSQLAFKMGDVFTLRGVKTAKCNCNCLMLDIGLIHGTTHWNCTHGCGMKNIPVDSKEWWFRETSFMPMDELMSEQIEELKLELSAKNTLDENEQIYLQTKSNYKDNGIYEDNETDD